jgi:hypothetical protein
MTGMTANQPFNTPSPLPVRRMVRGGCSTRPEE